VASHRLHAIHHDGITSGLSMGTLEASMGTLRLWGPPVYGDPPSMGTPRLWGPPVYGDPRGVYGDPPSMGTLEASRVSQADVLIACACGATRRTNDSVNSAVSLFFDFRARGAERKYHESRNGKEKLWIRDASREDENECRTSCSLVVGAWVLGPRVRTRAPVWLGRVARVPSTVSAAPWAWPCATADRDRDRRGGGGAVSAAGRARRGRGAAAHRAPWHVWAKKSYKKTQRKRIIRFTEYSF
jgi:hypothetical protein